MSEPSHVPSIYAEGPAGKSSFSVRYLDPVVLHRRETARARREEQVSLLSAGYGLLEAAVARGLEPVRAGLLGGRWVRGIRQRSSFQVQEPVFWKE